MGFFEGVKKVFVLQDENEGNVRRIFEFWFSIFDWGNFGVECWFRWGVACGGEMLALKLASLRSKVWWCFTGMHPPGWNRVIMRADHASDIANLKIWDFKTDGGNRSGVFFRGFFGCEVRWSGLKMPHLAELEICLRRVSTYMSRRRRWEAAWKYQRIWWESPWFISSPALFCDGLLYIISEEAHA